LFYLFLAPENFGTKLHLDPPSSCSFSLAITGSKEWIMLPPASFASFRRELPVDMGDVTKPPFTISFPTLKEILDTNEIFYYHLIQAPSQVVYVPPGMAHCTRVSFVQQLLDILR